MRRWLWRSVYPMAVVANRVFRLDYKWVNIGIGAWRRESFDPLWHHERYGDAIDAMPSQVNLCGIMYQVTVKEGMVTFVNRDAWSRLTFERDPHDRYGFMWYYEGTGRVAASHIDMAYRWIRAVFGGSHELKRPAI